MLLLGIVASCGGNSVEMPAADDAGSPPVDVAEDADAAPDTDTPEGAADTDVPADAGGDAAVDGSDASVDTWVAPPDADAGAEAGAEWCVGKGHALCEDFDPGLEWALGLAGGGVATLSTAVSTSPPHSLRTSVPAGAYGNKAFAWKGLSAKVVTTVHAEGDIRVEAVSADTTVLYVMLADRFVTVATGPAGLKLHYKTSSMGPLQTLALGDALTMTVWHHLEIDITPSTSTVAVKVDGAVVMPATAIPVTFAISPTVSLYGGIQTNGNTTTETVVFVDNLALDR